MQRCILLVLVFCFSVCIRIPFLGKKLEGFGHQEWLAGHTLIILKIWNKEGIAAHHYALPYTFYRKADKNIPFIPGVLDTQGNGYYVSYPPFAFYVLYGIVSILHIIPNEFFLQVVTLFIQFITGLLLYILARKCGYSTKIAQLAAYGYFLLPITLRYHTQAYFCDIFAQIGIVLTLIVYQNYVYKKTLKNAILLGIHLFFLTFTEWIGVFLAFSLIIYSVWIQKNLKDVLHYFIWLLCMIFAIGLTLWIYSNIAGWQVLKEALVHKANQRAVSGGDVYFSRWDIHTYEVILRYYAIHYYPILISIFIIGIVNKIQKQKISKIHSVFIICVIAIILHHSIFLNFTAENDFSILKSSIPLLIFWVCILSVSQRSYLLKMSYILLCASALYVTYKGMIHKKGNDIEYFASELVRLSPEDELLVLYSSSSISPQVMYYSERNVYMNLSKEKIKAHLEKHHLYKAVILYTDWQYHVQKQETIYLEQN